MNNNIIYDTLLTGDIVLFSGANSIISNIVQITTSSIWTHVGIVIKDPDFLIKSEGEKKGLYLLNSDGNYELDIESNTYRYGVQLVDLKKKVDNYEGLVTVRHLLKVNEKHDMKENERRNNMFKSAYQTVFEKSYDYIPINLIVTYLHNNGYLFADNWINCRHTDYMFCSALVAYLFTITGILEKNTKWSMCMPNFFTLEHNIHFNIGIYNLSPMLVLKNSNITCDNDDNINDTDDDNNNFTNDISEEEPYKEGSDISSEEESYDEHENMEKEILVKYNPPITLDISEN